MRIYSIVVTVLLHIRVDLITSMYVNGAANLSLEFLTASNNGSEETAPNLNGPQYNMSQPQGQSVLESTNASLTNQSVSVNSTAGEAVRLKPPPCPLGFIRHRDSCYHIIGSSELTWPIANTYCQLHGSKLVEINTEAEQRFIDSLISANNDGEAYWIGATNRLGRSKWRWESKLEPLTFSLWVSDWNGWVDEIESPSCALIDTTEYNQWMFWPCQHNFFMSGRRRATRTGIGLICEKESPRPSKQNRQSKQNKKRRLRKKNRRNLLQTRHWRRFKA